MRTSGISRPGRARYTRTVKSIIISAAGVGLALPAVGLGNAYYYSGGGGGNWNVAANWTLSGGSTHVIPVNGDDAYLGVSGVNAADAYFNQTYTGTGLNSLNVESADSLGLFILYQTAAGTAMAAVTENIGVVGTDSLYSQSNGSNTTTTLNLGGVSGTAGYYTLSGAGTLAAVEENVGGSGTGNFDQIGGTNTITESSTNAGDLLIGSGSNPTGNLYTLSGGNLNLNNSADLLVGSGPQGTFNQSGGTVTFSGGTGVLQVGNFSNTASLYNLSGTGKITGAFNEDILGVNGNAYFIQTGGSQNIGAVGSGFVLAVGADGEGGNYNLSGTGTITVDYEQLGSNANGNFIQSGGTNTVNVELQIGLYNGGSGGYTLNGGTLAVNGFLQIGIGDNYGDGLGNGLLEVNSGTVTVTGGALQVGEGGYATVYDVGGSVIASTLVIGDFSDAEYYLENLSSTATLTCGTEIIGNVSTGSFVHYSGTNTATGDIQIGQAPGSGGVYYLLGGTLNAQGNLFVGYGGSGTFNQTGGTATVSEALYVGYQTGSTGTVFLGPGSIFSAGIVYLGGQGSGQIVQSGGSFNIATGMVFTSGSGSSYTLTAGSLSESYAVINSGCTFNESGGIASAGAITNYGKFEFEGGGLNGSLLNETGGEAIFTGVASLSAGVQNQGTIYINLYGSLGVNAGQTLLNQAQIDINSGAIASSGAVVNNGTIAVIGTLGGIGGLTNNGLIYQGEGLLTLNYPTTPLVNYGTVDLFVGQNVSLTGNFNNAGNVLVNGAVVTGGTIANLVGGTVSGPGLITSAFSNAGTVNAASGTLNITSAWTNSALVELTSPASTLTGGAINNTGTIQGYGVIGSSVNNSRGTINAQGGTLAIAGTLLNPAAGTIVASLGNEVLVTSGLANNAGLISLTGGTFDNGGAALTNTGQITGYGTLRTGGLTNAGHITLSGTSGGATTTVTGNVTNNTGQLITIEYQPANFTGNIVNNGTIITVGTTVTFAGSYTGNAYISDPSENIFQSNVTISAGGSMTGAAGDNYSFFNGLVTNNGSFNNSGTLVSADNVLNNYSFIQTGAQRWSPMTYFNNAAGTAVFGSDTGGGGQNLSFNVTGGSVAFTTTQHIAALNISAGANVTLTGAGNGNRSVLYTPSLAVAGTLDLTANDLDLQNGGTIGLASVTSRVAEGYSNGTWTGAGITSSIAAGDSSHLRAVGVLLNTTPASTPLYTTFDGATVTLNDVLAKETWYGDTNLDGKVDGTDYSRIDNGSLNHLTGWYNGDFNYDGVINGSDYTLIDNTYNQQGAQQDAVVTATAEIGATSAAVPEPTMLGVLGVIGIGMLRKRGRISSPPTSLAVRPI